MTGEDQPHRPAGPAARDELGGPGAQAAGDEPGLPLLPGFREMALRRMATERRRLVSELTVQRQSAGLSQTQVAARMGTSQSAVARIESGDADVRASTLERYAAAIGSQLSWQLAASPPAQSPSAPAVLRGSPAAPPGVPRAPGAPGGPAGYPGARPGFPGVPSRLAPAASAGPSAPPPRLDPAAPAGSLAVPARPDAVVSAASPGGSAQLDQAASAGPAATASGLDPAEPSGPPAGPAATPSGLDLAEPSGPADGPSRPPQAPGPGFRIRPPRDQPPGGNR
jgi:transcriptional regulator with XRE-family HTH domain